ncbi:glycosyltransferase family 2 protein [Enorma phocaeensis]|uniref:Glycosyltransferase family A protein n=1 Tax=Enorma phocaeensis TaxID=1871019 RepID=A0ABT7V8G4_9ACTN|nr:glycosyltransferase family A protein [Enorma phocaeensis]MDM8274172.1 glycosyltransferase family A protein [Enorma phocaeensis]
MMRFSVIIPVYNVERYLPQCLRSVQEQTFTNYEVVLVNDGSTDMSLTICKNFVATTDSTVRVIDQRNRGLLMARRAGIDLAAGEYVVCLDSDDALRVDALETIDAALRRTDADVLLFQASRSESFDSPYFDYSHVFKAADGSGVFPSRIARQLIVSTHDVHSMCGKAIRRTHICQGADFRMYEGLQYGEDLLQTTRIFDSAQLFAAIPDVLYYYRDNESSISHGLNRRRLEDISAVRSELLVYARHWGENLSAAVLAGNCVETLAYCLMCVNRLEKKDACYEVQKAAEAPFFKDSVYGANLSLIPAWKRLGIGLLSKGKFSLFAAYIRALFGFLRFMGLEVGSRYQ